MPTPTKGPRLGGGPAHERLLLSGLATQLFEHGKITTTHAKAKRLRPVAEKLITFAKRGDLHARRQVLTVVRDKSVVHTLFAEIGPRFATRPGGYTRITKLGPRKGDNAPMAQIELVEGQTFAEQAVGEAERARRGTYTERTAVTGSTAEAAAELARENETAAGVAERAEAEEAAGTPAAPETVVPTAEAGEAGENPVPTEGDTEPAVEPATPAQPDAEAVSGSTAGEVVSSAETDPGATPAAEPDENS